MKRQSSFTSTDTDPESCASPPGEYETAGKVRGINYVQFPSPMPSHLQIQFSPLFPKYFTHYNIKRKYQMKKNPSRFILGYFELFGPERVY